LDASDEDKEQNLDSEPEIEKETKKPLNKERRNKREKRKNDNQQEERPTKQVKMEASEYSQYKGDIMGILKERYQGIALAGIWSRLEDDVREGFGSRNNLENYLTELILSKHLFTIGVLYYICE